MKHPSSKPADNPTKEQLLWTHLTVGRYREVGEQTKESWKQDFFRTSSRDFVGKQQTGRSGNIRQRTTHRAR